MSKELLIVTGPTFLEAKKQIKVAQSNFDGIELRVDLFDTINLEQIQELININKKETLITLRSEKAGGQYKGSIQNQKQLISKMLKFNIDYVDIESSLCYSIKSNKILCSFHCFHQGIENLDKLYKTLKKHKTKSIKLCLKANCENQAKRYLNFLEKNNNKKQSITMLSPNKNGLITRRYGPIHGNTFNYTPGPCKNKMALNAIFT